MQLTFENLAGVKLTAEMSPDTTVDEVVENLIAEQLIAEPKPGTSWALFTPGNGKAQGSMTLRDAGFKDGDIVTPSSIGSAG